jgi:hypothetical protein
LYSAEGEKKEEGKKKKIGKEYVDSYGNGPVLGKKGETYWITG